MTPNCNRSVLCHPPHCLELHFLGKEHEPLIAKNHFLYPKRYLNGEYKFQTMRI